MKGGQGVDEHKKGNIRMLQQPTRSLTVQEHSDSTENDKIATVYGLLPHPLVPSTG